MSNPVAPRISVVIPTCHRNDLLAKCLDCLAPGAQTLPPEQYEVIVTDDGSRSTAEEMVRVSYPWAKWIPGPCRGPASNRNNGAANARGEWLAFTDDDCLPVPAWLASYAEAITENAVYEGKTVCVEGVTSPLYQSPVNLTGGFLWSCNFMIQSALFRAVDGFDTDYVMPAMEDIDLHERLCRRGEPPTFVEAAVVDHPPRPIYSGLKSGKMYEAQIQYQNKIGNYGHSFVAYLKHLKHRLSQMQSNGYHKDTIPAYYTLLVESVYVIPHLPFWERKYHARYRA